MAIVTELKNDGTKVYEAKDLKLLSDIDRINADSLYIIIGDRILEYLRKFSIENSKKGKAEYYYGLGLILRDIYNNSGLVDKDEKQLYFKCVRLHLSNEIFPSDDISRRRNIPEQFFRLAGFPMDIVKKVKWTTWSYLFDSPILTIINAFDYWLINKLNSHSIEFNQTFSRLWFQFINIIFKNVQIDTWPENNILTAIDCMFDLCLELHEKIGNLNDKSIFDLIKNKVQLHRKEFILFNIGEISKEEYISFVLSQIKNTNITHE